MASITVVKQSRRALMECRSHEFQTRMTITPMRIHPATSTSTSSETNPTLTFRDFFTRWRTKPLSVLEPDDCRLFCWKDCVVYLNVSDPTGDDHDVFSRVWSMWYPRRAMDKDLDDESFFMKHIIFLEAVASLQNIRDFHEVLCRKLKELQPEIPTTKPHAPFTANENHQKGISEPSEYRLRPTFDDVFIVLEDGWQNDHVLLAWESQEAAERHGCSVGGGVQKYTGKLVATEAGDDLKPVFQCSLQRAIEIVTRVDPDRAILRGRYESERLIGMYGQDQDGSAESERLHRLQRSVSKSIFAV